MIYFEIRILQVFVKMYAIVLFRDIYRNIDPGNAVPHIASEGDSTLFIYFYIFSFTRVIYFKIRIPEGCLFPILLIEMYNCMI